MSTLCRTTLHRHPHRENSITERLVEFLEPRMMMSAPTFTAGPDVTVQEDCGPQTIASWATQITTGTTPIVIGNRIYATGADQPQLTAVMTDGGNVITDSEGNPISFDAYIDTGASGFVTSYITAHGYTTTDLLGDTTTVEGLDLGTVHGNLIGPYTDSGLGGPETGDVTSPMGLRIRNGTPLEPTVDPDTLEITPPVINLSEFPYCGQYNLWVRRQEGYGEHTVVSGIDAGVQPLDVVGMPVIDRSVLVMDPTTIGFDENTLTATRMDTQLLSKGSAVPTTNMDFRLRMNDFVGSTPATGEVFPSHSDNPVFDHVTLSNTLTNGTVETSTNNTWLFDTGSTSTMISFAKAKQIGLIDPSDATFADFMASFSGLTLPIAGVGSLDAPTYAPILTLPQISIPDASGTDVVWKNVDVLVVDVAGLDGVFGLNLILPASTIDVNSLSEVGNNPGYFDKIVFDTKGDGTADLKLMYDPGPGSPPPASGAGALSFQVSSDAAAFFSAPPSISADGTLTFTPAPNANGVAHVTAVLTDGADSSAPQQFTLTVDAVNDTPTATPQTVTAPPGQDLTLTLGGSDIETAAADLTPNVPARSAHGTLTPLGNHQYQYAPDAGFAGIDNFTFTVTDSGNPAGTPGNVLTSAPATVTLLVFNKLSLDAKGSALYQDANHVWVKVTLKGGGTGSIYFAQSQPSDASLISLSGTTDRSTLTIAPQGRGAITSIGGLHSDGPVKSVKAGSTNVAGSIDIGSAASAHTTASLTFDDLTNTNLTSQMPIKLISVAEWLDTDGQADLLKAPSLGSLTSRGLRGAGGDFQADLLLQDPSVKLSSIRIAGDLSVRSWDIAGSIGSFSVRGRAWRRPDGSPMIIRAGGSIGAVTLGGSEGVDVLAGIRPAVQGETLRRAAAPADFTSSAFIASVTIKGMGTTDRYFSDSSFSASRIGAVKLTNVQWDNGTAPFGFFARNTRNGGIRFVKWKDTKAPRDPLLNGSWTPRQGVVNASPGNDLGIQLI